MTGSAAERATPSGDHPHSAPKLVFRSGPLRGCIISVDKPRVSIGRDPRNDIAIAETIISSYHAAIVHEPDGEYWLEDLDSKNGTFLRGQRIARERLRDGDTFHICAAGPEIGFTLDEPSLPSIFGTVRETFLRTRSISRAIAEVLPKKAAPDLLNLTGVKRVLDDRLEKVTRRSRTMFVASSAVTAVSLAIVLAAVLLSGRGGTGGGGGTPVAAPEPPKAAAPPVRLAAEIEPIFGSLFLSYREAPIGWVEVANDGAQPVGFVELALRFREPHQGLLAEPWTQVIPAVEPHASARIPIRPKLSTEVLSDRTREVTAVVTAIAAGSPAGELSRAVFVHARNIASWSRPEGVAAFVDPDDPAVVSFVREVWSRRPPTGRGTFPPPNIIGALTLLTALAERGLAYLPDARSPVSERVDGKATDRVSYPGETLLGGAGDCDDLSVLACAVLECARIPTALAVGSSHVFPLFDIGMPASRAADTPLDAGLVVAWKGRLWMPIEATDLARPGSGFASAWAAAWPRVPAISAGEINVVEIAEAWKAFQPMNPPPDEGTRKRIVSAIWARDGLEGRIGTALGGLRDFFRQALESRVKEIERSLPEGAERAIEVGLLYARSGLLEEARGVIERSLFGQASPPPVLDASRLEGAGAEAGPEARSVLLTNLGICISQSPRSPGDLANAAACLEAALQGMPEEPAAERAELLLRAALVHRLRGDLAGERSLSSRAFSLDSALAATYREMVGAGGPVAGPEEEKVMAYLKRGLKRTMGVGSREGQKG